MAAPVTKLNLGCGKHIEPASEGWCNIDWVNGPGVNLEINLDAPFLRLPFGTDCIEFIYASHIFEHIHNILPLMGELWRVSKPGAQLMARVPHGANDVAFEDPTHIRQMFPKSFLYFGQVMYNVANYNYSADWEVTECTLAIDDYFDGATQDELALLIQQARNVVNEIWVNMRCNKPPRAPGEGNTQLHLKLVLEKTIKKHLEQPRTGE